MIASERLFFALWPEARLRDALVAERAGLIEQAGTPNRPTRLSHPLDLHLTLVFIGAVNDETLPCIGMAADDVVLTPFTLTLDAICDWPEQALWLACPDAAPDALLHLVSQLQQNLLVCGLQPEPRRYRPHVTLARKAPSVNPCRLALTWQVGDFVLAASAPGRTPSYRIIRRWPLAG